LHDVSLTIRRGEIYGLIGPNGAGKTTFFNCLTGLYKNESGHFVFDGTPLAADAPHKAAEARNCPHLSEHSPVRQHDGDRERHGWTPSAYHAGVFGAITRNRATMRRRGGDYSSRRGTAALRGHSRTGA
jgi:branched-chain amino acid transport system ATP-binding protein